jgi:hypothetical protein
MTTINDGGPAFPRHALEIKLPDGSVVPKDPGMTLRDWFATHATEADIAAVRAHGLAADLANGLGTRYEARYIHADAMLRAREVKP